MFSLTCTSALVPTTAAPRSAARRVNRSASRSLVVRPAFDKFVQATETNDDKFVKDGQMTGRDSSLVGGFAGGEKNLVENYKTAAAKESTGEKQPLHRYTEIDEETIRASDKEFPGRDEKKSFKFTGRDDWFTGGLGGGELGLKVDTTAFEKGDYVKVNKLPVFAFLSRGDDEEEVTGTVKSSKVNKNGRVEVVVSLYPFGREETYASEQLEIIKK